MKDIRALEKEDNKRTYIVGVDEDGSTRIFIDRSEEYVLNEGYVKIWLGCTYKEAVKAEKHFLNRNTVFCVIAVFRNGELEKLKLRKHVGVLNRPPIGTIGIFKRRRDAKKFMTDEYKKLHAEDSVKAIA